MHQASWRHPRSKHWHQLDLVITRRTDLASILLTRSYHSADCGTDHALIASRVRATPKKLQHSKKKGRLCITTCCVSNPEKTQQFIKLEENFHRGTPADDNIDTKWPHLRNAVYTSAIDSSSLFNVNRMWTKVQFCTVTSSHHCRQLNGCRKLASLSQLDVCRSSQTVVSSICCGGERAEMS